MGNLAFTFPQPLSERYQPQTIAEFVGLEKPKRILESFCANPYPSAWLFCGPSGTGKTSIALAICRAVAGELHHIPSQSCDLATVKAVTDRCHYYPRVFESGQPGRFHFVLPRCPDEFGSGNLGRIGRNAIPQSRLSVDADTDEANSRH